MRPVVIAGPTASGKSALALALAERDGGWVINADALQVYACWRVLTARPDAAACARAPHRLYGHISCTRRHSVGAWLAEARSVIAAAQAAGARPVIVGGSGLYLSALTTGLAAIPGVPPDVRTRAEALRAARGVDGLIEDLARDDPATLAQIDRANPMRVQRAWEVLVGTGRGLAAWQADTTAPVLGESEAVRVICLPDKLMLNNRIKQRFNVMIEEGALEECARFRAEGGHVGLPAGRALGAAELIGHLEGRLTLEAATEAAIGATRRYAKRQRTWLRSRMADWVRVDPSAEGALATIPPA